MSKKFIFSAVALMAFSFAGMANEIEEKKVEVEKIKIEAVKLVAKVDDPCVQTSFDAADAVQATMGIELSPLAEGRLILQMYEICDANR